MSLPSDITNLLNSNDINVDPLLDQFFGINYDQVESQLIKTHSDDYADDNLMPEAFLTSYLDFKQIYGFIPNNYQFVDLGAAYFRSVLFYQKFYKLDACGVEISNQRVDEAKRVASSLSLDSSKYQAIDILDYRRLKESFFFCYLPAGNTITHIILNLMQEGDYICVVESHGDCFAQLDTFSSLEIEHTLETYSERHDSKINIYKKSNDKELLEIEKIQKNILDCSDDFILINGCNPIIGNYQWIYSYRDMSLDFSSGELVLVTSDGQYIRPEDITCANYSADMHVVRKYQEVNDNGEFKKVLATPDCKLETRSGHYISF